jgi:hypothetical protein
MISHQHKNKVKEIEEEIGIPFSQQGRWTLPGPESPCPKMAHGLLDPMLMWICLPANNRTSAVLSAANTTYTFSIKIL